MPHQSTSFGLPREDGSFSVLLARVKAVATSFINPRYVILVVVAHPDDEALGPGATLATLAARPGYLVVLVVLAAEHPVRRQETQRAASLLGIPSERVFLFELPDGGLAHHDTEVFRYLRLFADLLSPDMVFSHKRDDHSDHCVIYAAVRGVFGRNGVSLAHFRIPQPTHSEWNPNLFVRVPEGSVRVKLGPLYAQYRTENGKDYFAVDRNKGILLDVGVIAGSTYAEAFEATHLALTTCRCGCAALVVAPNPARRTANRKNARGNGKEGLEIHGVPMHIERVVLEPCTCGCNALAIARNSRRASSPLTLSLPDRASSLVAGPMKEAKGKEPMIASDRTARLVVE